MGNLKYYSLHDALGLVDEPNRIYCRDVLIQEAEIFRDARGSGTKHQSWKGGYLDHITETMNLAILFYELLYSTNRPLNFTLSDALLVMFLHDLEKPFKQLRGIELELVGPDGKKNDLKIKSFREELFKKYKFVLTKQHLNAIRYAEGENEDYHPNARVMNELAAFCHMCDIWSARGWYNFPEMEVKDWKS